MKKTAKIVFGLILLLNLAACCNITYQGKENLPLPESAKVEVYFSKKQIPVQNYSVMGKAVASAGTNYTVAEIEKKLKILAREKGANGVFIISIEQIPAGGIRSDQLDNSTNMGWIVNDSSGNAFNYLMGNVHKRKEGSQEGQTVFKHRVESYLLLVPAK